MKEKSFINENGKIKDPKLAEEAAYIEKPYRESSIDKIKEADKAVENFLKRFNPNSQEFDIVEFEKFLREQPSSFKHKEGSIAGELEREIFEDNLKSTLKSAEEQHRLMIAERMRSEEEQKEQLEKDARFSEYDRIKSSSILLLGGPNERTVKRFQPEYYYNGNEDKIYEVIKDTTSTGKIQTGYAPSVYMVSDAKRIMSEAYGGITRDVAIREITAEELERVMDKKTILEKISGLYD